MSVVDEIKARIDIVDLVSESVKLRRSGKSYSGFCPFHANSRTPAFVVFPESGTWRCFGQCNEGGDVFGYVMKKEGWDFPTALKSLADRTGVEIQPLTQEARQEGEEYERLRALLEEAVTFYRHQLFQTPAGQAALDYLHKREIKDAIIESFGLGYAPLAWEAALSHFKSKGYSPEELLQAGMATERDSGGIYDRFRNRIMFPIRDGLGHMVGFGARILDPNDVPKFLNSPQTALFDKGRLLYGLDQARKAIRAQDQVVIVEGYLDVIALHQGGFANTVSPMGTALTEDQLRMLKRYTRRIVLALDADAAGEKATLRGLEIARTAMDRGDEMAFDARGLLRHEARLQADLRVTTLPPGMDPDEVVNRDPAEWGKILEVARPVVVHVMETLAAGSDLDDPKAKGEIAAKVLQLIEDVPDPVERDAYRQRLARLLKVDERSLSGPAPVSARPKRQGRTLARRVEKAGPAPAVNPSRMLEAYYLGLLTRHPDALYQLDRALQQAGLSRMIPQDFENTDYQVVFRLIQQALEQDEMEPQPYLISQAPETLQSLVQDLLAQPSQEEPLYDRLIEDLVRSVMRLRLNHVYDSLNQLRFLQEDLQEQGDLRAVPYQNLILQHAQIRDRLDRALRQPVYHA
ncbi:MAG TPA: DNA primase [Anaerolineaceae bacterium]